MLRPFDAIARLTGTVMAGGAAGIYRKTISLSRSPVNPEQLVPGTGCSGLTYSITVWYMMHTGAAHPSGQQAAAYRKSRGAGRKYPLDRIAPRM